MLKIGLSPTLPSDNMEKSLDSSIILCEKIRIKRNFKDITIDLFTLLLHFSLLTYRLLTLSDHGFAWLLAFLCESWFAFERILALATMWTPLETKTFPQTLLQRYAEELPAVDVFVTTADAILEPPILTINTVLSLMAVEYPANKLACYVSDDGCSPLVLYSLIEASNFARLWLPFCKKYDVQVRAPFRYFTSDAPISDGNCSPEFLLEWKTMKDKYEMLVQKIEAAANGVDQIDCSGDFLPFANTDKTDHPSIIKVIWENKERDPEGLPHLIYVCREKRPNVPHHYKAGAMNVLTRVSGLMTNAPLMLNVDCDMFVNNPKIFVLAMCAFIGLKPQECAFVQFPQDFYNKLKHDPFGNHTTAAIEIVGRGFGGIQGPFYMGTGCFHRRKLIYAFSLDDTDIQGKGDDLKVRKESFGSSMKFIGSVAQMLSVDDEKEFRPHNLSSVVQAATEIARCDYEIGTAWGKEIGWGYGSVLEDILTGIRIHAMGYKSVYLSPKPPGFLGTVPTSLPATLAQKKRWIAGFNQVLFSKNSPIVATFKAKLQFRQCLSYTWILLWGVNYMHEICYSALSAFCIITNSRFLPKANEPAMAIFVAQFLINNGLSLLMHIHRTQSAREWWNKVRMAKISSATSKLFGNLSFLLKLLGISDISFDVTRKDQSDIPHDDSDRKEDAAKVGRFTFDASPMFVPGTTFLFLHLTALATGLFGDTSNVGFGEFLCSVWMVLCFWPFVRGLVGKGKYGIPSSTILKSASFALIIVQLCKNK